MALSAPSDNCSICLNEMKPEELVIYTHELKQCDCQLKCCQLCELNLKERQIACILHYKSSSSTTSESEIVHRRRREMEQMLFMNDHFLLLFYIDGPHVIHSSNYTNMMDDLDQRQQKITQALVWISGFSLFSLVVYIFCMPYVV